MGLMSNCLGLRCRFEVQKDLGCASDLHSPLHAPEPPRGWLCMLPLASHLWAPSSHCALHPFRAQGSKPKLKRTLDHVGEVWSKAVIGVTLAVLVALPLLDVPLLGPRGALYRAMGVVTAGSPCAVVLVPLACVGAWVVTWTLTSNLQLGS